jgi:hypothetical protein
MHTIATIAAVALAVCLFQTATLIIGGHIAKGALAGFYQAFTQEWQRMLIVIIPLSGIGNLLAAYAFQNPIIAGVAFLVLGLWAPLLAAFSIHATRIDPASFALLGMITVLAIVLGFRLSS